jgi:hypothetical protein
MREPLTPASSDLDDAIDRVSASMVRPPADDTVGARAAARIAAHRPPPALAAAAWMLAGAAAVIVVALAIARWDDGRRATHDVASRAAVAAPARAFDLAGASAQARADLGRAALPPERPALTAATRAAVPTSRRRVRSARPDAHALVGDADRSLPAIEAPGALAVEALPDVSTTGPAPLSVDSLLLVPLEPVSPQR